jgi:hypothetical protein
MWFVVLGRRRDDYEYGVGVPLDLWTVELAAFRGLSFQCVECCGVVQCATVVTIAALLIAGTS